MTEKELMKIINDLTVVAGNMSTLTERSTSLKLSVIHASNILFNSKKYIVEDFDGSQE